MKLIKLSLCALFVLSLALATGCTSHQAGRTHTNVLGLYERETSSYTEVPSYNLTLRRSEIDPGAPISGNRTTVLWGVFTYYDY